MAEQKQERKKKRRRRRRRRRRRIEESFGRAEREKRQGGCMSATVPAAIFVYFVTSHSSAQPGSWIAALTAALVAQLFCRQVVQGMSPTGPSLPWPTHQR
jgi:ADP-ribosylglycohydrolase